jgi:lipooligosaccharide transport system ATP-binding protein
VNAPASIIDARGLCKDYGPRRVVSDVSFTLSRAECLGLLGPNGAGKTTTIRMVTCFTAPSAGTLTVLGLPTTPSNHAAIKAGLGIVQQEESLDPDLSVEQNLVVYASYFGIARSEAMARSDTLVHFAALADHRTARIRTLSGGMTRRLMLARALLNEPRLLVLDEPTTGLDPQARRLVWERVRSLKRQGTTILLTTHYMEEAAQLCDRLIIMDHGRIVAHGTPAELIAAHVGTDVVEIYLGDDAGAARIVDHLGSGPWRAERVGEVLYLYLSDADAVPRLVAALDGLAFTRRRATLEDVFLTLTGHALRD